jgi:hypothetical protein
VARIKGQSLYVGCVRALGLVGMVLALAGCGSVAAAELPPPAGPKPSPPLTVPPATPIPTPTPTPLPQGETNVGNEPIVAFHLGGHSELVLGDRAYTIDRRRDRLAAHEAPGDPATETTNGRVLATATTGREPVDLASVDRGTKLAVLTGRERTLELYDARTLERLGTTGAGIGPVRLATDDGEFLWVTDVEGDALLVFRIHPRLELIRRVHVAGGPYAIARDAGRWRLWISLSARNEIIGYTAGSRPIYRETYPSIRDVRDLIVLGDSVLAQGPGTQAQRFTPRSR